MKTFFISIILIVSINHAWSQNKEGVKHYRYDCDTVAVQLFLLNSTKDTVFYFHNYKDTAFIDEAIFYTCTNKFWIRQYPNNKIKEKGRFKKWKGGRFVRHPIWFLKHWAKKHIIFENKKCYPMFKVGKWNIYNNEGGFIESRAYSRYGMHILPPTPRIQ